MGGAHQLVELGVASLLARGFLGRQHALVVARHHLDQLPAHLRPAEQQLRRMRAAGERDVPRHQSAQQRLVLVVQRLEIDHAAVAALLEVAAGSST